MSKRRNAQQQEELTQREALEKELQKRNGHYTVVNDTIAKAKALLPPPDQASVQEDVRVRLEPLRNTLEKKRSIIELLNEKIENLLESSALEKDIVERSELEEAIEEIICRINKITDLRNVNVERSTPQRTANVKLPKLSLSLFDGNPTEWITFWDSFQSTVHEHPQLSKVDKFKYLQKSLTGNAAHTIAGLQITNENYDEAIDLLEKRFGNKQIIISRHIESLMDLPKISGNEDLRSLRILYDRIEAATRSLNSIGVPSSNYSAVLSPIIMSKLPQEVRLIISRKLDDEWSITGLVEALGEELTLREKCALASIGSRQTSRESRGGTRVNNFAGNRVQPSTTSTLIAEGTSYRGNGNIPICLFCGNKHFSASCTTVTDPNVRKKVIRDKKRCFLCLRGGHLSRNCGSNSKCYRCHGRHHSSICGSRAEVSNNAGNQTPLQRNYPQHPTQPSDQSMPSNTPVSTNLYISQHYSNEVTLLQTARAQVHGLQDPSKFCNVRVILDSCSQKTYITTRLRDRLNLPTVNTRKVLIKEFGNVKGTMQTCDTVQLAVKCADNLTVYINAFVVPLICSPISNQVIDLAKDIYPHLKNLPLADSGDGLTDMEIDVMIGADFMHCFTLDHVIRGEQPLSPVAILTRFGFVLSGPVQIPAQNVCSSNFTVAHVLKTSAVVIETESKLSEELKHFWDYENLGVKGFPIEERSDTLMNGNIEFTGERYQVSLPVKDYHPIIPDNYALAAKRLSSLINRLQIDPEKFEKYDSVITEQLSSGIIEKVNESVDNKSPGSIHYIPHTAVLNEGRQTTKLRIVYDASSKAQGEVSLNECLEQGPNLLPLLFDVLLRFRMEKVALIGDLEKAFLQVEIEPRQRDLLRFLWIDRSEPLNPKIVKLRFARLPFGLTCSPYILNSTIRYHLNSYNQTDPEFVRNVVNALYVDDYASSFASDDEAYECYLKLKQSFMVAGFNMRKWASNSRQLMDRIDSSENEKLAHSDSQLQSVWEKNEQFKADTSLKSVKVLGITWNPKKDALNFDFANVIEAAAQEHITKRLILSTIARFYDPLGLLSPAILPLKHLFQKICMLKINWDTQLPNEICETWSAISDDIASNPSVEIERCASGDADKNDIVSYQLHGFADASHTAYGCVVYLRIKTKKGVKVKLLTSKCKVCPLKGETIPRLELMAALLLAQVITSVYNALKLSRNINKLFCWSDSQIVLYWIYGDHKVQKSFVQNRLNQIRALVDKQCWNYCSTKQNPADIVSRGMSLSKLCNNDLWWNGPEFLYFSAYQWPKFEALEESEIDQNEERKEENSTVLISSAKLVENVNNIIPCENFSCFSRLIRITSMVLKFVKLLRGRATNEFQRAMFPPEIINEAKTLWVKEAQRSFKNDKQFSDLKKNLRVFFDSSGILRVGGRIDNAPLPYDTKHPMLLPREHHLTKLIVLKSPKLSSIMALKKL